MMRLTLIRYWCPAVALAAVLGVALGTPGSAQDQTPPPQGVSRGERMKGPGAVTRVVDQDKAFLRFIESQRAVDD